MTYVSDAEQKRRLPESYYRKQDQEYLTARVARIEEELTRASAQLTQATARLDQIEAELRSRGA